MVSDLVLVKELPDSVKQSVEAYIGCLAGAVMKDEYIRFIENAGFGDIRIVNQSSYPVDAMVQNKDISNIANSVVSVKIHAVKS